MSIKCDECKRKFDPTPNLDLMPCPGCRNLVPTGNEKSIRKTQEKYRHDLEWPKAAAGRAIAYAAGIYALSTHATPIDFEAIEQKVRRKYGQHSAAKERGLTLVGMRGAHHVIDTSVSFLLVPLTGVGLDKKPWHLLYVVFRGSRGSKAYSEENVRGAGWGETPEGELINVDWRSNFTTSQVTPTWSSSVKIHKGFNDLYMSMRGRVHSIVKKALAEQPEAQVVVTGHSLGAALSTVCAHDLQCSGLCEPFVFPFCSPRVGALSFCRDFDEKIATSWAYLQGEPKPMAYPRSFVFVQSNDPVSWGGKHGFKHEMNEKEAKKYADSGNIAKQGLYAQFKFKSDTVIYYHVGNLYRASYFGLHDFGKMEREIFPD